MCTEPGGLSQLLAAAGLNLTVSLNVALKVASCFCWRGQVKPDSPFYFPIWNIMVCKQKKFQFHIGHDWTSLDSLLLILINSILFSTCLLLWHGYSRISNSRVQPPVFLLRVLDWFHLWCIRNTGVKRHSFLARLSQSSEVLKISWHSC